jgi:hypothetical protein
MIAGFGGELVSHAYVEQHWLLEAESAEDHRHFERHCVRWWREVGRTLGPASGARTVADVAAGPLFEQLGLAKPAFQPHPLGLIGACPSARAVVLCLPWSAFLSPANRAVMNAALTDGADWSIVTNGRAMRIDATARSWTRSGIELDFELICASAKGVSLLWRLGRALSVVSPPGRSLEQRLVASEGVAARVCSALGDGVLAVLPPLAAALHRGRHASHAASFDQALTLIYRILFLLFAEARALVPTWHDVYRDAYSVDALLRQAGRPAASGLWESLQAISRLAHAGCEAGDLVVTAFNGRLFSPRHAPLAEQLRVPDTVVRDVLLSLATESTRAGRRRIAYADLGVEQLGSVYERLLEYEPEPAGPAVRLTRTSSERKNTGSFYTPRSITEFLVRRTLAPLVEQKSVDEILRLRVLDPAMGSGAFLVAACRYLSDCCEQAMIRETGDADRPAIRRRVAERCLYGVDLNPAAVQLARLSLWLTTLAADRPLTFLDHHLAAGNSLIGARVEDLSRPPRQSPSAPVSLPLFESELAGVVSASIMPSRLRLALTPSDSLAAVKDKERVLSALAAVGGPLSGWTLAADAWCGAALAPGAVSAGLLAEMLALATGGATTMPDARLRTALNDAAARGREHRVLHWQLVFPEVFFDSEGRLKADAGFDAVLGNPPWDMLRADSGSARDRALTRSTTSAVLRFYRSGVYRLQAAGHVNRYQLFVERALQLTRAGGRIGLILPSGIATDHGSAALRRHLLERTAIDTWLGYDNRRRIFPIHRSVRFVVCSATAAGTTTVLRFRNALTDAAAIDRDAAAPLVIARSRLEAWDPERLSIPECADASALAIKSHAADAAPPLGSAAGWGVRFGRELNATDDRPSFVARSRSKSLLPIVEGKQISPFRVALERSTLAIPRKLAGPIDCDRERIAYRDVASATNRLTLIAGMLPAGAVSTHTVFVSKTALDEESRWCLLGILNSLVANYLVRLQVTTHVTTSLMARLPVPRPPEASDEFKTLTTLARRISVAGIETSIADYAELNAVVAGLYGLSVEDYGHVLNTFPLLDRQLIAACLERYQQHPRKHGNTESLRHRDDFY